MANLTVYKYPTADGAEAALEQLKGLQAQGLITVLDAAIVTWPTGKKKPKTRQAVNMTGVGALDGAFWGMLFGLIFFMPLLGGLIGAGIGALGGHFTDIGIDDDFIRSVREQVTEGSSALFLMSQDEVVDRLREAFGASERELLATNLSKDQEAKLKASFSAE
ncbi:DUF1269 domain-containing protein [Candidatus Chloroploca sp. M-50]|uniref:DUF1269 domain-containing protein n=1 Tax=Candidatus Chloroploca mongolica TaxID=2528176 RepID=A0ABS4DGG9_9CHLR|nr:DUF1269 domain-containing protein [Candidatus Chloroploca mongolica]MBP1468530.1 DUF1269 domain-containing protein [Candidatus Chloroploca mongolica]